MRKSTHTAYYEMLCAELRRARHDAGLSQRALAELLAVSPSWVAKVETGERRMDVVEFCWFMGACGENCTEAFGRIAGKMSGAARKGRGRGSQQGGRG